MLMRELKKYSVLYGQSQDGTLSLSIWPHDQPLQAKKKTCGDWDSGSLTDQYTTGDVSYLFKSEKKSEESGARHVMHRFYHMINDDNIDKIYNSTATDISGDLELYYSIKCEQHGNVQSMMSEVRYLGAQRGLLAALWQAAAVEIGGKTVAQQMHVLVEVVDGKEVMRVDNIMADVPADDRIHRLHHVHGLRRTLLMIYDIGKPDLVWIRYTKWLSVSVHLYLKTDKGVRLLDRIVASV
jgi:hypothetical protein